MEKQDEDGGIFFGVWEDGRDPSPPDTRPDCMDDTSSPEICLADSAAARWIRLPSAAPHLVEHHAGAFLISRHKHNVYHDMLRQSADASAAESELIV